MTENEMILTALTEYEENNYESEGQGWQSRINALISKYQGEVAKEKGLPRREFRVLELDEKTLERVAEKEEVEADELWELYVEIMERNFSDDLCEIVRENEEELK